MESIYAPDNASSLLTIEDIFLYSYRDSVEHITFPKQVMLFLIQLK